MGGSVRAKIIKTKQISISIHKNNITSPNQIIGDKGGDVKYPRKESGIDI